MIYSRALGDALRACLERDPRVVLLGEDIESIPTVARSRSPAA